MQILSKTDNKFICKKWTKIWQRLVLCFVVFSAPVNAEQNTDKDKNQEVEIHLSDGIVEDLTQPIDDDLFVTANMQACYSQPRVDLTLSLPIAGVVKKVAIQEGATVEQGALLYHLDDDIAQLNYQRAELQASEKEELKFARLEMNSAKKLMDSAKYLARNSHSISKDELNKAILDYQKSRYNVLKLVHDKKLQQIEADTQKLLLEQRALFSPIKGTVVKNYFEIGATVQANQTLVRVVDTSVGILVCSVDAKALNRVKYGDQIDIVFPETEQKIKRKGKVIFTSPLQDAASGLRDIKLEFDNTDGSVVLGSKATIKLPQL